MMFKRLSRYLAMALSVLAVSFLAGCATTEIKDYSITPGVPYANLKSEIVGSINRSDGIWVYIRDQSAPHYEEKKIIGTYIRDVNTAAPNESLLFKIYKNKPEPSGYVKVPAGEKIFIRYYDISGSGRCVVTGYIFLEPGESYSLVGGVGYEKGWIPFLNGARKCSVGVLNDSSKSPVPIFPAPRASPN